MKRVLLSAAALAFVGSAIAATPDPAELPGGLSGKNIIHDTNSAFNGQTITSVLGNLNTGVTDAQTTANAAIPLTQKGAASGVAPLDANSLMSAGVSGSVSAATATASYSGSVARTVSDHWADRYNVRDFGASMTGSASDSTSISSVVKTLNNDAVITLPCGGEC